ncbi:MAG: S-layer homology domain-containing protein, partial [Oscillospiraceae bacterium]|nr:S-layer homology domain-containing protein [Oscillospiraceae bacterium]
TESAVTDGGSGVVKVNGGYITGGYAKETGYTEGGCIYIGASGTFTMHGGTILGNKAAGLGGGIWSGGKLNIGGNSRVNYNSGSGQNSGVYLAEKANAFNISGTQDFTGNKGRDIVFNNNTYIAGTRINFTAFNPDVRLGRVYIQTNLTGVITSGAYFTNDDELNAVMQPLDVNSVFRVNADHQAQIVHVHSFTYAAGEGKNANRITATCSNNGCVLPLIDEKRTATLTIAAPAHTVYGDGKDPKAVITDTYNIQGDAVVSYYAVQGDAKTGKALSKAPTDAGRYWAEITLGSATAHVVYTISPAPIYIDVSPATYKISLPAETEGGKLTASRATAPKGATVTITAAPDEGYQAVKPTVTDKDGKEIPVTENADGSWSFPMPGSDVTVKGGFEKTEPAKPEGKEKFVDVPADAWYHDDVYWAVEKGITLGVDDTHFAPDADCTRDQFVTFLWRAAGQPVSNSAANPFVDVKADDYYYDAVLWAVEKGITKGTDDTHFDPDKPVTRAQAITFLYRYEQSEGRGFTGLWAFRLDYSDAEQVPDWAYEAFCWMVKENICKGSDGKLEPDALCPRCQVVALLARIFNA